MTDFETAMDQMLAGSQYEGDFDQADGLNNEFESFEYEEQFSEFEGDFESDELDDLDDAEFGYELEWESDYESDFEADLESNFSGENEWSDEFGFEMESSYGSAMLSEAEINELAQDLVAVSNPQEMEAFFGKLKGLVKGIKKVASTAMGGGIAKKLLKAGSGLIGRALPLVGSTLGTALLPGVGTGIGGALGGQLKKLFSRRGRRSFGRSLARRAVRSARRTGRRNPLASLLGRRGGALRSLFGFEAESVGADPQYELAKRVVRTVADAADIASRNDNESDAAIAAAIQQAANKNLPPAVRAAMLTGPVTN